MADYSGCGGPSCEWSIIMVYYYTSQFPITLVVSRESGQSYSVPLFLRSLDKKGWKRTCTYAVEDYCDKMISYESGQSFGVPNIG